MSTVALTKKTLVVAGLPVHVYAEQHAGAPPTGPVAVLFFLHGRTGSAKAIEWVAEDALRQVAQKRRGSERATELIVVTFVSGLRCCRSNGLTQVIGPPQPRREAGGPTC